MTFQELCNDYGMEEIPGDLRQMFRSELRCRDCSEVFPNRGKLYTDRGRGFVYSTRRELNTLIDEISDHCFCRFHAEQWLREPF